jgi:magnesium transporter
VGLPPGSIVYVGKERTENASIEVTTYTVDAVSKAHVENCSGLRKGFTKNTVNWINVDGIHNYEMINQFEKEFQLDHLLLEDVVNTNQRPKLDERSEYLFLSLKMLTYNEVEKDVDSEQVSIFLGADYIISFQEKVGDVFSFIRERIETGKGQIRTKGNDYLFYSLIDSIIDNYFVVIENVGTNLEDLEEEIFNEPTQSSLEAIQRNKNILLSLRRSIYPLRESINKLLRDNADFIDPETTRYFNDVYDHTIQIIDILESYKDIVSGLKDSYMSSLSLKMNQVMQVLTIIATIFIPLTFIVGIYGMNFEDIPELHWKNGYLYFWILTIAIVLGLVYFFKRKKWL